MYRPPFFALRAWFPRDTPWRRHAAAIAVTLAAWAACDLLAKIAGSAVLYVPFLAAVAVAAAWDGRLPAAIALAAGLILTWAVCLSAHDEASLTLEAVRSLLYLLVGATIIACVRTRRAASPREALLHPARIQSTSAPVRKDAESSYRIAGHLANDIDVSDSEDRISQLLPDTQTASRTGNEQTRSVHEPLKDLEVLLNLIPVPIYLAHDAECRNDDEPRGRRVAGTAAPTRR